MLTTIKYQLGAETLGVRYAGPPLYYVSPNLYFERKKAED